MNINKMKKIAKELGDGYLVFLYENAEENSPEILREYLARTYPFSSEGVEEIFEEAIEIAKNIEDNYDRAEALRKIGNNLIKIDILQAKEVLERAIYAAEGIRDHEERAWSFRSIAVDIAQVDLEKALDLARKIEGFHKVWALNRIVTEVSDLELSEIDKIFEESLETAKKVRNKIERDSAFEDIAKKIATVDIGKGLKVAKLIEEKNLRLSTIALILSVITETDIEKALQVSKEIDNEFQRLYLLGEMATHIADKDADASLKIAREIKDKEDRAPVLREIAIKIGNSDFEKALDIMEQIDDSAQASQALGALGERLSIYDSNQSEIAFQKALELARNIEDKPKRAVALTEIAQSLARTDSSKAKDIGGEVLKIMEDLRDEGYEDFLSIRDIAVNFASTDPEIAVNIARNIEDKFWKASALAGISGVLARVEPSKAKPLIYEAKGLCEQIDDKYWKVISIKEIADEMAKIDVPEAERMLYEAIDIAKSIDDDELTYYFKKEDFKKEFIQSAVESLAEAIGDIAQIKKEELATILDIEQKDMKKVMDEKRRMGSISISADVYDIADKALLSIPSNPQRAEELLKQALSICTNIIDEDIRGEALAKVVSVLSKIDPESALMVAKNIDDKAYKAASLSHIALEISIRNTKDILRQMSYEDISGIYREKMNRKKVMEILSSISEGRTKKEYKDDNG